MHQSILHALRSSLWNELPATMMRQCGWLKDKYGLSWPVVPAALPEMMKDSESAGAKRVMGALMRMKKIDVAELEHASRRDRVTA